MNNLKDINERINLEHEEKDAMRKTIKRTGIADTLRLLKEEVEDLYPCITQSMGKYECNCVVCVELPAVMQEIDEAIEEADKEDYFKYVD